MKTLLEVGGEKAGTLELATTSLADVISFCDNRNFDIVQEIPDFSKNFQAAKQKAAYGWTRRREMPVIRSSDVQKFQARLERGEIDINKPFAEDTVSSKPFPEGLSGLRAQKWLDAGLRDGDMADDVIDVKIANVQVGKLIPIQKQIYVDRALDLVIKNSVPDSLAFIGHKSFFILSADNYIIDGHHRFLAGMLIDSHVSVNCLQIDLPIKKLLPLAAAYGDAIGNQRNESFAEFLKL